MRSLDMQHGSEGSQHDPYSYTERIMYVDLRRITLHEGLAMCLEATEAGAQLFRLDESQEHSSKDVYKLFEHITGLTTTQFDKAYQRVHGRPEARCPTCKGLLLSGGGYVGEEVIYCSDRECGYAWFEPVTLSMIE